MPDIETKKKLHTVHVTWIYQANNFAAALFIIIDPILTAFNYN